MTIDEVIQIERYCGKKDKKALEELQKEFPMIDGIMDNNIHEQIAEWLEELKKWRTSIVNKDIKNPFVNTSTLICHNCDHKDEYIIELELGLEDLMKTLCEMKEQTEEMVRMLVK